MRYLSLFLIAAALAGGFERPRGEERDGSATKRRMDGPRLGLVFDTASRSLRPAFGLPGAVRIGDSLTDGTEIANAEVSPKHDSALAVDAAGAVFLVTGGGPAVALDVPASPSRTLYSPGASLAALAYPDTRQIRKLRFENAAAVDAGTLEAPDAATALAISDRGAVLAATGEGTVYLSDETGTRTVGTVRKASAAVFLSDTEAAIADEGSDTVFLVRGDALLPIAGDAQGVAGPAALAGVDGNRRVLVANRRSGTVLSIGLDDGVTELTECNCRPETLRRTLEPSVFWLNGTLLFDAKAQGRVWFAPAREGGEN